MRADRLRANGAYLRPEAFQARKEALVAKDIGALHEQVGAHITMVITVGCWGVCVCAGPMPNNATTTLLAYPCHPPPPTHNHTHRTCRAR